MTQPPGECPICEGKNAHELYRFRGADVVECLDCHMIYVPAPASEITSLYKESYYESDSNKGYQNYRSEFESHLVTFTRRLEESERVLGRKGRMLDLGCALGHCGEAGRRSGWEVYVTDVSDYAVGEARRSFGLNGLVSGTEALPLKPSRFDLVTLYDVIEHLSQPMGLLSAIKRALSGPGILHVSTPNARSLSARLMGKSWYHFKPDEHLLYFTPETLRGALERAGFEVLSIKPAPTYMKVGDILKRLERYSGVGARLLRRVAELFRLSDLRLKIYVGEMQAFARAAGTPAVAANHPVTGILDIVCCPSCQSDLQLLEETEAMCLQCKQLFGIDAGVINFCGESRGYGYG